LAEGFIGTDEEQGMQEILAAVRLARGRSRNGGMQGGGAQK